MVTMFERNGGYVFQTDNPEIYKRLRKNCKRITYSRDDLFMNSFEYSGILTEAQKYLKNLVEGQVRYKAGVWIAREKLSESKKGEISRSCNIPWQQGHRSRKFDQNAP
ncbi:MAG TPA: hypothetical protein DDX29_05825 [Clostridiales bacterium]|nr:hypothetical protein [Clostridiales bacterium]